MQSEPFDFTCDDGRHVRGRLDRPAGQARGWALFAHCFTCSKESLAASRVSTALAALGVGTMRIDFAGIESGEPSMPAGFSVDVSDLVAAGRHMATHGCAPQLLIGHSLGGAAAICAAGSLETVKAVATIGAPFHVDHVLKLLGPKVEGLEPGERQCVEVGGRPVSVGAGFAEDLKAQDQAARLGELKRALLVMHSPVDEVVSIDEASGIFQAAKHPKSFVSLDKANHLLTDREDADYAAVVIAAWASKFLDEVIPPVDAAPADGVVRVTETGVGKFQARVQAGGAVLMADEPVSVGGLASGPTPYELVAAGLGACTVMTLRMYADLKGLPLAKASIEVRHEKDKTATPPDRFERTLTLDGDLDEAQRAKLLEIADKCPVHRTLEGGAAIVTTTAPGMPAPCEEEHFAAMEDACAD